MTALERRSGLSPVALAALADFVTRRIGLACPPARLPELARAAAATASDLDFRRVEECIEALVSGSRGRSGIEALARHLTNGETYFFREPDALAVLGGEMLPGLIEARRGERCRLRLWSAGCATGEEPYTLAMLLEEVLPDLDAWDLTLLGTDINPDFLRIAAKGSYRSWSFRGVASERRERFFSRAAIDRFDLDPRVSRRVGFAWLNLAGEDYPSPFTNTHAMDVILCRNVLMYLDPDCARRVVRRFAGALDERGWLVVGASECSLPIFDDYEAVRRHGAVLYRKRPRAETRWLRSAREAEKVWVARPQLARERPPAGATTEAGGSASYRNAHALYRGGRYAEAADRAMASLAHTPRDAKLLGLVARIHANTGALRRALAWSERALDLDKADADAHYLHATILSELAQDASAVRALNRVLYLAPDHALAHYTLGVIAFRERACARARQHLENARSILAELPPDEAVDEIDGLTHGKLLDIVHCLSALVEQGDEA
jgi:chemotaxis protein methyltransferase CheR